MQQYCIWIVFYCIFALNFDNLMKSLLGLNPDVAGFWTSMLCAIHCSAIPLLIAFGAIGSNSWLHNHMFDWVIIGTGLVIAGYSLLGDYMNDHQNKMPIMMAFTGFVLLFVGMIEHHGIMLVFSVVGGLTVASSHIVNHRLSKSHQKHS
jgi:MerC mercury resistance protein